MNFTIERCHSRVRGNPALLKNMLLVLSAAPVWLYYWIPACAVMTAK